MRRKTAVTIARTGPYDPQAVRRHSPRCLQDLDGPLTHSTGIIFLPTDPLDHIALVPIATALALVTMVALLNLAARLVAKRSRLA